MAETDKNRVEMRKIHNDIHKKSVADETESWYDNYISGLGGKPEREGELGGYRK